MEAVFGIGLNVGTQEPADQLEQTLYALVRPPRLLAVDATRVLNVAVGQGEWEGMAERFVQARVAVSGQPDAWRTLAQWLAGTLRQEAVAVLLPFQGGADSWVLVFADGTVRAGAGTAEHRVLA